MSRLTAQLIISLLDRVSAPARAVTRSMAGMRQAAAQNAQQMNAMRGKMLDAVGVGYVLARAISAPVHASMRFQSAMADVRKVVDFPTPAAFKEMSNDILEMSKSIALSATSLAAITAAAGQAGMAGDELLKFTELAAKAAVAFDISAGAAGESLAKIKTALGMTVEETGLLADAFNHLSNNTASSAPDIINYMRRVASVGKQFGFTADQTAAIGAAMIAAGAPAEVAATSFRNVGRALARGASATKGQKKAFVELGLSATDVAKRLQTDAVGTLNDVLTRIRALPRHLQASNLSKLFGDEARAIAPLLENAGLLEKALALVADQTRYAGSATEEFAVRSQTAENKLQLFRNKVDALAISLGDALLPAIAAITQVLGPLVDAMATWAAANPQLVGGIAGVVAGLAALRITTIAARYAFAFLKGGLLDVGIAAGRSATLVVAATKRMRLAVLGASMLSSVGGAGMFSSMAAGIGSAVSAIVPAAAAIGTAIAGITAPVWGLVAAIAAVGFAVYRYWEPISNFVVGFAQGIYGAIEPLISFLTQASSRIATAIGNFVADRVVDIGEVLGFDPDAIRAGLDLAVGVLSESAANIVALVKSIPGRIGDWISDIFTMKDYSSQAEADFRDAGRRAGEALANAVKAAVEKLIDWFAGLPGKIIAAIGSIDLSSLIRWPQPPNWWRRLTGGAVDLPAAAEPALAGTRAAGGPVAGGRTYLVGERGPELFTPPQTGRIVPNDALAANAAQASQRQAPSIRFGDIHIHGAQDVDAIVAELENRLRDALQGIQADVEWAVG